MWKETLRLYARALWETWWLSVPGGVLAAYGLWAALAASFPDLPDPPTDLPVAIWFVGSLVAVAAAPITAFHRLRVELERRRLLISGRPMNIVINGVRTGIEFDPTTTDDRHLLVLEGFQIENLSEHGADLRIEEIDLLSEVDYMDRPVMAHGSPPSEEDVAALTPEQTYLDHRLKIGPRSKSEPGDLAFVFFVPIEVAEGWTEAVVVIEDELTNRIERVRIRRGETPIRKPVNTEARVSA